MARGRIIHLHIAYDYFVNFIKYLFNQKMHIWAHLLRPFFKELQISIFIVIIININTIFLLVSPELKPRQTCLSELRFDNNYWLFQINFIKSTLKITALSRNFRLQVYALCEQIRHVRNV